LWQVRSFGYARIAEFRELESLTRVQQQASRKTAAVSKTGYSNPENHRAGNLWRIVTDP